MHYISIFISQYARIFSFFAGSQKKIYTEFALCGPNQLALVEAWNRGPGTKEYFFKLCFLLSKYLPKVNCVKIFMYGEDYQINEIWVQTGNAF